MLGNGLGGVVGGPVVYDEDFHVAPGLAPEAGDAPADAICVVVDRYDDRHHGARGPHGDRGRDGFVRGRGCGRGCFRVAAFGCFRGNLQVIFGVLQRPVYVGAVQREHLGRHDNDGAAGSQTPSAAPGIRAVIVDRRLVPEYERVHRACVCGGIGNDLQRASAGQVAAELFRRIAGQKHAAFAQVAGHGNGFPHLASEVARRLGCDPDQSGQIFTYGGGAQDVLAGIRAENVDAAQRRRADVGTPAILVDRPDGLRRCAARDDEVRDHRPEAGQRKAGDLVRPHPEACLRKPP
jgi:hypothetical protein